MILSFISFDMTCCEIRSHNSSPAIIGNYFRFHTFCEFFFETLSTSRLLTPPEAEFKQTHETDVETESL